MTLSQCTACEIPGAVTNFVLVHCPNPGCRNYRYERLREVQRDTHLMRRIHRWAWEQHLQETLAT